MSRHVPLINSYKFDLDSLATATLYASLLLRLEIPTDFRYSSCIAAVFSIHLVVDGLQFVRIMDHAMAVCDIFLPNHNKKCVESVL